MNRLVFAPAATIAVCVLCAMTAFSDSSFDQQSPATKAAPASQTPPPAPAKWIRPVKGQATIEVLQGPSKKVGGDIVTVVKVRNTSAGPIALLKCDEYWYDKKMQVVTGDTQRQKKPVMPGEIVEFTMKSPVTDAVAPTLYKSQYMFTHGNGDIKATGVKKFDIKK